MERTQAFSQARFSSEAEAAFASFESSWSLGQSNLIEKVCRETGLQSPEFLVELIRIDMELFSQQGRVISTRRYLERFPTLQGNESAIQEMVFEEFRLRRALGEMLSAEAMGAEYQINTSSWSQKVVDSGPKSLASRSLSRRPESQLSMSTRPNLDGQGLPTIPSRFSRFELVGILGQGALGRVYLARQDDLSNRFVALKVTTEITEEPQHMAAMLHTNIVPIYSLHRVGNLQAICMPFLGVATLADLTTSRDAESQRLSGREWISTIAEQRGSTLANDLVASDARTALVSSSDEMRPAGRFASLANRNIEETLVWLFQQLSEGLRFAHEHGVIHGDIKPANILLADDGRPLLLDFHLSQKSDHNRPTEMMGGTLPYMAPEHLKAFQEKGEISPPCDLFSLGAVFYKLLTDTLPYPVYQGSLAGVVQRMLEDRQKPPRPIRELNSNCDLDFAAIIEKCLEPDPRRRYATAGELSEDLQRHSENLPLKFAPNRSWAQRIRKWARRYPGLTSVSTVATILLAMLILSAVLGWNWRNRTNRLTAIQNSNSLLAEVESARIHLTSIAPSDAELNRVGNWIDEHVGDPSKLNRSNPLRSHLPPDRRDQEESALSELQLHWSGAAIRKAKLLTPSSMRTELITRASQRLEVATQVQPRIKSSRVFHFQQSELAKLNNQVAQANEFLQLSLQAPIENDLDQVLSAYQFYGMGQFEQATELLESRIRENSQDFEAWLLLGNLRVVAGQPEAAAACYSVCIGLDSQVELAYFGRARAKVENGDIVGAIQDFGQAIQLNPHDWSAFANRAQAYVQVGDWKNALADFTNAIELGSEETRVYLLRANVHRELGNEEAAAADYERFVSLPAIDEDSLNEHGIAMLQSGNVEQAQKDFDAVLALNPDSVFAWQNKSHVFSEMLQDLPSAIQAMNHVVEANPANPTSYATRGVLHARHGDAKQALADAQRALDASQTGDTLYRVAGIYSLLSKSDPQQATVAVGLIARACLADPQTVLHYLGIDPDLEPIKGSEEFQQLQKSLDNIRNQAQNQVK